MLRRTFMLMLAAGQLAACVRTNGRTLRGITMGTTYAVTVPSERDAVDWEALQGEIERTLAAIVASMSTYERSSELSVFNHARTTDWQPVSPGLLTVIEAAMGVGAMSGGAFDVTVGPLVELWGFGPRLRSTGIPSASELQHVRAQIGQQHLQINKQTLAIAKRQPSLQLDLSSIAKGYGVDCVAAVLEAEGIADYLIDIGGEIRAHGVNPSGNAWRIAVAAPLADTPALAEIITTTNAAIATSGNYRDVFTLAGRRYPHVLDPASGEPVDHPPLSVTVVAASAMQADALATALLVMGPDTGHHFADNNGIAALFTIQNGKSLHTRHTHTMRPLLAG